MNAVLSSDSPTLLLQLALPHTIQYHHQPTLSVVSLCFRARKTSQSALKMPRPFLVSPIQGLSGGNFGDLDPFGDVLLILPAPKTEEGCVRLRCSSEKLSSSSQFFDRMFTSLSDDGDLSFRLRTHRNPFEIWLPDIKNWWAVLDLCKLLYSVDLGPLHTEDVLLVSVVADQWELRAHVRERLRQHFYAEVWSITGTRTVQVFKTLRSPCETLISVCRNVNGMRLWDQLEILYPDLYRP